MPPVKHALLSASSASRWLVCTAAPRFEEGLPESTSEYAEEGRLAHAIGELKVTKKCTPMSTRTYNTRLNKLKKDPLYTPEMDKTTDLYLEHITEQVMAYDTAPTVAVEVQVDFSDYVPEGFGTCDCCIIGGDLLSIVDYKHGKGVPVSAVGNPQMRLYALGALHRYAPVFGDTIKRVRMTIDQPRLDSYTTDEITVEELRAWGESIKPIAQKAFSGLGEFVPGDHCRFCRGKAQCRARANINTALEDFKDCVPAGAWNEKAEAFVSAGGVVNGAPPPLLTDAEIGDLLERGAHLVQWYKDLEAYATEALLAGKEIPGWKLVAGRSIRTFTDQDAAIQAVIAAGYDETEQTKDVVKVEVMHGGGVDCFVRRDDGTLEPDDFARSGPYITTTDPQTGKETSYNWERIPLVCFKSSHHEIPLLSRVKCLQDAYNNIISNFANQMEEDIHSTILVIKNYDGEDLGRLRANLATYGIIKVRSYEGSEGGVDTLQIEVNAENYKVLLSLLKDAIIENARGYDAKDDRMSGNPNQMNIQSMYSDIDLDANGIEMELWCWSSPLWRPSTPPVRPSPSLPASPTAALASSAAASMWWCNSLSTWA